MKPISLIIFFFPLIIAGQTIQRQTISSADGSNSLNNVSIRQTIGQPFQTQTHTDGSTSFKPGFQQPIFSTEILSTNIQVTLKPNPALFSFSLETSDTLLHAILLVNDASGKIIFTDHFEAFSKTEVQCALWANGLYFISLKDSKGNLVSSKLIKSE
jgi:hypothetical protein